MRAALVCFLAGCTVFDGLEPTGAGGTGGDPSGAGGAGGEHAETCTTQSPRCLLPQIEAARLCSLIATCDELATGIALSTGIMVAEIGEDGSRLAFNFSACVDWLTTPLEGAHEGFDAVRAAFNCLAATPTCGEAAACLTYEALAAGDARCDGESGVRCEGDDRIDCDAREVTRCDGVSFPVTTKCEELAPGEAVCRVGSCEGASIECLENPPGVYYAVACTPEGDEIGTNCTAHSLSCKGAVGCTDEDGESTACAAPFAQTCGAPKRVEACTTRTPGGQLAAAIECGEVGLECVVQGQTARCGDANAACSPYDAEANVCDPDTPGVLELCVRGAFTSFDCRTIGMDCANGDPGLSGRCE